jgi:hypothetical protein
MMFPSILLYSTILSSVFLENSPRNFHIIPFNDPTFVLHRFPYFRLLFTARSSEFQ